jgi:putative redox protein
MADAKAIWKGKMSFDGTAGSGFTVPMGSRKESGGDGDGFSPMELVLVGLAGCTAMDVISILEKKRQDITDFTVSVHGDRCDEHPRVYNRIHIEYQVTGRGVDRTAVERAVELSETKYCSAQAMLSKTAEVTHSINVLEAELEK